jgi:cytochrome c biogenesis protein CcdA
MSKAKNLVIGFKEGSLSFGLCISTLVNSFLLLIVYLLGIAPTSLIAKLFGKSFLKKKPGKEKTYWKSLDQKDYESTSRLYKQF